MVDAWLLIVTIVGSFFILALNIYLFVLYSHPDDNKDVVGWIGRIIVIAGNFIIFSLVCLIPLDTANARGDGGGINTDFLLKFLLVLNFLFIVFLIPTTIFLYETDDEEPFMKRLLRALCYESFLAVVVIILSFIAYGSMKKAELNDIIVQSYSQFQTSEALLKTSQQIGSGAIEFEMPPFLFMMVFWIFLGWFVFVIFGGIGLIALPLDLILDYFHRPRPRPPREIAETKVLLRRRVEELLGFLESVRNSADSLSLRKNFFSKWRSEKKHLKKENQLKKELLKLEQEYEIFETEQNLSANPVSSALKLALGCFSFIFSFCLLIQIVFYELVVIDGKPRSEFLNDLFVFIEFKLARFIATILFTLISAYILLTVLKGNLKFGMRFLFFMPIHTMKIRRTFINSFLFNSILIMLCTPAIIMFIVELFEAYLRLTSTVFVFSVLVKKMDFFKFFYEKKIFIYFYLFWSLMTFLYLMC